jgi:hypothetical protein
MELQSLLESAWACPSEELAQVYLDQLKACKAIPEIRQLCMASGRVSSLAQKAMEEIEIETPWAAYY